MHKLLVLIGLMLAPSAAFAFCAFEQDQGEVTSAWMLVNQVDDGYELFWECTFEPQTKERVIVTPALGPKTFTTDLGELGSRLRKITTPTLDMLEPCDDEPEPDRVVAWFGLPELEQAPSQSTTFNEGRVAGMRAIYQQLAASTVAPGQAHQGFTVRVKEIPHIPVRASQTQHALLTVYTLTESRMEPANFSNGFVPNNGRFKPEAQPKKEAVFRALMDKTREHHPKTTLVEFAWRVQENPARVLGRMQLSAKPMKWDRDMKLVPAGPIVGGRDDRDQDNKRFRGGNAGARNAYRTRLLIENGPDSTTCWKTVSSSQLTEGPAPAKLHDMITEPFPEIYLSPRTIEPAKQEPTTPVPAPARQTTTSGCQVAGTSGVGGSSFFLMLLALIQIKRRRP